MATKRRPDAASMVAAFASSDFSRDTDSWNEAVEKDKGGGDLTVPEADEDGNYSSPILESILQGYGELSAGEITEVEFAELLNKVEVTLAQMLSINHASHEHGLADPENPITQATRLGFEEHLSAITTLKHFLETKESKVRNEGLALLQKATNRLVSTYAEFQRLRIATLVALCPSCGAENRKGSAKCKSCLTLLPTPPPHEKDTRLLAVAAEGVLQAESPAPIKTPNYERIERALQSWDARDFDDECLLAEINAVEANMMAHRQANAAEREDLIELTDDEQDVMFSLLDAVDEALEANLRALARMKKFFSGGDPQNLRAGFEQLAAATGQIVEAYVASQALINAGPED